MKKFLLFLGLSMCLYSCDNQMADRENDDMFSNYIENLTGVERDITIDVIVSHYGSYKHNELPTRGAGSFSITPYTVDEDTVFFIAQFPDGWDIYSANQSTNKIIFSSNTGIFNIDDPEMPIQLRYLIEQTGKDISRLNKIKDTQINDSWSSVVATDEIISNANTLALNSDMQYVPIANDNYPPGEWILLESTELGTDTYKSPRLTKTKWGQEEPWDTYTKLVKDSFGVYVQAPTGCGSVAIGQYMYFTHFKDNEPAYSVTTAIKTANGLDYSFSGNSSTIWNEMALNQYSDGGQDKVALLLGNLGRILKADYGVGSTGTYERDELKYLNDTYGDKFSLEDFNFVSIKNSIDKGYPMLVSARSNQDIYGNDITEGGHLFLVEQYSETIKRFKNKYALVRDKSQITDPDRWKQDLVDIDGNIIQYAYIKESTFTTTINSTISMNWGQNGSYNYMTYSPYDDWTMGDINLNLRHKMYYRSN